MNTLSEQKTTDYGLFSLPVIAAALGYFVDIYDLTVFSILRVPSLKSLGLTDQEVSSIGTDILNWQLAGIILGGILWGILGDKLGRRTILFGSILLYSLANITNGFVYDTTLYTICRFIAGIGLAGELGAGITLVSELLPKHKRSYATSLVTGFGLLGAACAYLTYELVDWRNTYIIGGVLGLALLLMRSKVLESHLFQKIQQEKHIPKGNFFTLLFSKKAGKYLACIGVALPIYFFFGMFAAFGNEIGTALHIPENITPGKCVMYYYLGLALGDLFSGPFSQLLKSRKKVLFIFLTATMALTIFMIILPIPSDSVYYLLCFIGGITTGYWAMFILMTAEQFGTNLRATATTSAPNMVRGALILMTIAYKNLKTTHDVITSVVIVGGITFFLAYLSYFFLKETYNKELDYHE